ncbi:MAG: hypothetical protein M3R65_00745 [Gemmatimonadota bacterium]|nr:hypothetical protein [Gemmatimonadota bacterium]
MFGCLRRVGCLILLAVIVAAGWYWWTVTASPRAATSTTAGVWQPVTAADAASAGVAVASLRSTQGKVYANLTPAEAVAYLVQETARQLPPSSTDVQAMVSGDQLHVRAVVPLRELGAERALGPLASMIGARDTVELAGRVDLIRAGLAQMHVTRAQIHELRLPGNMIPGLVQQMRHTSPSGIAPDAFPIPLPEYIGDIRIADGKVTLYKNVQ